MLLDGVKNYINHINKTKTFTYSQVCKNPRSLCGSGVWVGPNVLYPVSMQNPTHINGFILCFFNSSLNDKIWAVYSRPITVIQNNFINIVMS